MITELDEPAQNVLGTAELVITAERVDLDRFSSRYPRILPAAVVETMIKALNDYFLVTCLSSLMLQQVHLQ